MCHVLIIEDEPLVAMAIEDVLLEAGATTVDVAVSEEEAVRAAAARRPDFISSDVRLVEGTGPAAVQAIHGAYGAIPVLFVTATPEACRPCAPPGTILRKPFSAEGLTRAFRAMVG